MQVTRPILLLALMALISVTAASSALADHDERDRHHPGIRVTRNDDLRFGSLTADGSGAVTIDPRTGHRGASGRAAVLRSDYQRGEFVVQGRAGHRFRVFIMPATASPGGGTGVSRILFQSYPEVGSVAQFDGSGRATVYVGGTLSVSGRTSSGAISVPISITVEDVD